MSWNQHKTKKSKAVQNHLDNKQPYEKDKEQQWISEFC